MGALVSLPQKFSKGRLHWDPQPTWVVTTSFHPSPLYCHGEGWRGRLSISTLHGSEALIFWDHHLGYVASTVIEANED